MKPAEFDHIASSYDSDFTYSNIGLLQRQEVWKYLDKILINQANLQILELNCGTGEDATYLASKGHHVTATDVSTHMIEVVKTKAIEKKLEDVIETTIYDINLLKTYTPHRTYDIVFSNFGGFNCVDYQTLENTSKTLSSYLKQNGIMTLVIMPRWCLWEIFYFTLKLDFKNTFRRFKKNGTLATVGDLKIQTWYYTKKELKKIFTNEFEYIESKPIGIAIPPSYLNTFFKNKKIFLRIFYSIEKILNQLPFLSNFSDHLLISFRRK